MALHRLDMILFKLTATMRDFHVRSEAHNWREGEKIVYANPSSSSAAAYMRLSFGDHNIVLGTFCSIRQNAV